MRALRPPGGLAARSDHRRAGGFLFVTIHDETTWGILREDENTVLGRLVRYEANREFEELPADFIVYGDGPESQTSHRSDYFRAVARRAFDEIRYVARARGYQDLDGQHLRSRRTGSDQDAVAHRLARV